MQSRVDNEWEKPYISAAAHLSIAPASLHSTEQPRYKYEISDQCELFVKL